MFAADAILELERLVKAPDADRVGSDFNLALGALLVAAAEYPDLDIEGCQANLNRMASAIRSRMPEEPTPLQELNTLTDLLFGVIGFAGNRDNYYDPRNSYLNEVLDRRIGIPITLSLLCVDVGRRAGVPVRGIGMPGHFLVNHPEEPDLFVDTFSGGVLLNEEECAALLKQSAGEGARLQERHLTPVTPREMLARLLRNLKAIYWEREDFGRCIVAIGGLMAVLPDRHEERRDRGVVHLKAGHHQESEADFAAYLEAAPNAEDARTVRNALSRLRNRNR